jgi:uncharacterized membrane protein
MNLASYTYWLAEQASGGIFYIGWASVLILTLAVVSGWFQRDGIKEKRKNLKDTHIFKSPQRTNLNCC